MNKFEENFIGLLANKWGFYIKDYYSKSLTKNKYVAITENDNFAYCVVVSNEKEADNSFFEAQQELQKLFTKLVVVNVVIVTEESTINLGQLGEYSKLVYSLKDEKVVYSHDGCKPLLPMIEYMNRVKKTKKVNHKEKMVTYILMTINIIIFLLSMVISKNIYSIDTNTLVNMGAKVNILINDGQVWRLLTCTFLHGGLMHIFFNMYALLIIGSEVEYVYGKYKYLAIYFISALGGSLFSYIFSPNSISVGASGAVFGLLGAMLAYGFRNRKKIGKQYMMNIIQVIGINIFIGITLNNIDNAAHLGGLVLGAIVAIVLSSSLKEVTR